MSNIILRMPLPPEGTKPVYPLDDPLLSDQLTFFKVATGIEDDQKLKHHICEIQDKAFRLFPFPCVFNFDFVRGKVVNHPMYRQAIEAFKKQAATQNIFVDFGASVGSHLRNVIYDGWKREDVLGVEITPEWIRLGYELFKDADRPVPYFIGDILKPEVFDPCKSIENIPNTLDLFSLKDLNSLKGRVNLISAHFFFHLFGKKDQERLAECLALLLSDQPGSAIIGMQRGTETEGLHSLPYASEANWYSHSDASWSDLWQKCFEPGSVKIVSELKESTEETQFEYIHGKRKVLWLHWSVTRL